jgi:hypothetical protein
LPAARVEERAHAVGLREGSGRQRAGRTLARTHQRYEGCDRKRPTRWSSSITAMSEASPDDALDKTHLRALSRL